MHHGLMLHACSYAILKNAQRCDCKQNVKLKKDPNVYRIAIVLKDVVIQEIERHSKSNGFTKTTTGAYTRNDAGHQKALLNNR